MVKFISIVVSIEFLLWLIPLGAFIDPAKEGWVCGGQRAICLCSLVAKSHGRHSAAISFKTNPQTQKEKLNPSSNHYLVLSRGMNFKNIQESFSLNEDSTLYHLLVSRTVEHVPKI